MKYLNSIFVPLSFLLVILCVSVMSAFSQTETPPPASAPKTMSIPAVLEQKLSNGLTVAVVQRNSVPLVTVQVLIKSGASSELDKQAGLANITADMLTKGTKSRSATQIAEDVAFLGGSIDSGAGWNSSFVSATVTPDKLDQAMNVLSDVTLNPAFKQDELDLLKSQTLDELKYNLKQPSFLANYVASVYSFVEHPAGGTPESIQSLTTDALSSFHQTNYVPNNAVLIFAGDINLDQATKLAQQSFGGWRSNTMPRNDSDSDYDTFPDRPLGRILVIDLPASGQAAVAYVKPIRKFPRGKSENFYPASVFNSVLGGGYSSRLNYEIRIKRGLSYGAGSSLAWRKGRADFITRAQTKNPSAAEVAELTLGEIKKMTENPVSADELVPRKSTLTGSFGLGLETTAGLARAVAELYSFDIPPGELNSFVSNVRAVTDADIKEFASKNILKGDIIIVGDYSLFKDDLAKRFPIGPGQPFTGVDVIKADDLDLSKPNLRK